MLIRTKYFLNYFSQINSYEHVMNIFFAAAKQAKSSFFFEFSNRMKLAG